MAEANLAHPLIGIHVNESAATTVDRAQITHFARSLDGLSSNLACHAERLFFRAASLMAG